MVTIALTGQLQTMDGECDLACEIDQSLSVRQLIQRQGVQLRHLLQLLREKKCWSPSTSESRAKIRLFTMGMRFASSAMMGWVGAGLAPRTCRLRGVEMMRGSKLIMLRSPHKRRLYAAEGQPGG